MERPTFDEWLKLAGLPPAPPLLVDEVRRKCACYVLEHGGDPGTIWDVTFSEHRFTVYPDWIFEAVPSADVIARAAAGNGHPHITALLRTHLGRFENDPEAWLYIGTRAWLPLSMIPPVVAQRWGTALSGEAVVSMLGRDRVEFRLLQTNEVVPCNKIELVGYLRGGQILLAPADKR